MRKRVINVKKINFKNIAKKIAIYGLVIQLLLTATGCGVKKDYSTYDYSSQTSTTDTYVNTSSDKPLACTKVPYSNNDVIVKFTSGVENSLLDINSMDVEYPYEELFNENYSISNFVGDTSINKEHNTSILQGGKISSSNLYSKVIENNKNYSNKTLKEELSGSEIQKICGYIAEAINTLIDSGKIKDVNEVACALSNLKIFEVNSMNDASVNKDNCLLVTPSVIKNNAKKHSNFDYYKYVIQHEAVHFAQHSCEHVIGDVNHKYGFSEVKESEEVNMYEYLWLYEAHASKAASDFQNQEPVSYKSYVDYLNMTDYSNALKGSSYDSLMDIALSRNINDLYSYFKVSNETEKREVDKFMFATDIALNGNKKFFNAFSKQNTGISDSNLKQSMKVSICEFLSKNFYKSLISSLKNNSMSLDDIYYLISVFEANLDTKIYYSSSYDYENNKDFFEFYTSLQNEFFDLLALNTGIEFDEVVNKFNNYSLYKEDGKTVNCSNNFSSNMNNIVSKLHTKDTYFQGNIRQYSDYYNIGNHYSK